MRRLTRSLLALVPVLIALSPAPSATAHDLWISRNGLKPEQEWVQTRMRAIMDAK